MTNRDNKFDEKRHIFANRDTFLHFIFLYLPPNNINLESYITIMSITYFFRVAPVFATILTLAYAAICGMFIYMFVQLYRNK